MNATFTPIKNLAAAWNTGRAKQDVTIAVIGDEQSIATTQDIIERSSAPSLEPHPSLMDMKILTAPKTEQTKPSMAAKLGKAALTLGLGAAGAALAFTGGAVLAGAAGALGVTGGVLAGAALLGAGVVTDKLSLTSLGVTAGMGALALTGSPIAGGLLALGLVGTSLVGMKAGAQLASKFFNG